MFENIYIVLSTIGVACVFTEVFGKVKEGLVMLKNKSARGQARLSKLLSTNAIFWQTSALILGLYLGHNNFVAVAIILPLLPIYGWLTYLCFKFKKSRFQPFKVQ